jgi:L-alanine-DL-glutamate epimerase-like enolase superfamily enzyme
VKITDIKTFLVHPGRGKNWLLVKVETDEGLYGWGECYTQADRDRAIEAHVHALKRYLVGRGPFDIKHTVGVMYHDWAGRRGAMDYYCAISGIEHALWDIVGKACGQPVYNLLGGRSRDRANRDAAADRAARDKYLAAVRQERMSVDDLVFADLDEAALLDLIAGKRVALDELTNRVASPPDQQD